MLYVMHTNSSTALNTAHVHVLIDDVRILQTQVPG
jgi:hypothetical protein